MARSRKQFAGLLALFAAFFLSAAAGWAAIDPSTVQKLQSGGFSVSVDGNIAVTGDPNVYYCSGAAYVFIRDSTGEWTKQTELLVDGNDYPNIFPYNFGGSISVSGETILIGAMGSSYDFSKSSAYVFVRDSKGDWIHQAELAPDGSDNFLQYFGRTVAISGNTAVIAGYTSGLVYVFNRTGTV